jgi:hypothetical protein
MVDVKNAGPRPALSTTPTTSPTTSPTTGPTTLHLKGGPDLSKIPDVTLGDVQACLKRSRKAAAVHDDILGRVADGRGQLSRRDLEGMLARAGVETTDVKTVLAYHAKHTPAAFDDGALTFLSTLDFSDVFDAHIEELQRQNKEQVESHQRYLDEDRSDHARLRADDARKLQKTTDEKQRLQKKSAFELEAEFAEQTSKSGLSEKEAALLLLHRKRFTNT